MCPDFQQESHSGRALTWICFTVMVDARHTTWLELRVRLMGWIGKPKMICHRCSERPRRLTHPLRMGLLVLASIALPPVAFPCTWTHLQPGLDLAECDPGTDPDYQEHPVIILRVDPSIWELRVVCAPRDSQGRNRTARDWCQQEELLAATNAGMFATDYQTHVGYLRSESYVQNTNINEYRSLLAIGANTPDDPDVRIFDLDVTSFEWIRNRYNTLVQNLRLIKRPGINRWSQQKKRWSEAALGEDGKGNILFIFSRVSTSMHELNAMLLALPLDLRCAQHLEGGPEAQLYIGVPGHEQEHVGSFETGFFEKNTNTMAHPVPNVIGIVRRGQSAD